MAPLRQDRLRQGSEKNTSPRSIVYCHVDELKLDPCNPRRHSKKQIRQIANSITTFGFNVPCIVDQELRVVSGHGRLAARPAADRDIPEGERRERQQARAGVTLDGDAAPQYGARLALEFGAVA